LTAALHNYSGWATGRRPNWLDDLGLALKKYHDTYMAVSP
jgi:hypothetical protein